MKQIIYVDILIVINIYINYGLLLLTCVFGKIPARRLRMLFASLFGGIYSLIILIPHINDSIISVSRIPALIFITFIAFGYEGKKAYIRTVSVFFCVNMLFAGAMFMLWFLVCPENMYYNSGVVYFGVDALTLVVFTIIIYLLMKLIAFFTKSRVPENFIYTLNICVSGKIHSCRAFYDSGNCLYDPFSGDAVTIVSLDALIGSVSKEIFSDFEFAGKKLKMKLIPVNSISGNRLLPAFRADRMVIRGVKSEFIIENPLIAVCPEKIHSGEYGAILHSSIFDNTVKENGDNYVLHT